MSGKESETQNTTSTPKPPPISTNPKFENVFHSPAFINPDFTHRRRWHLLTTTVYSLSSDTSWLYATGGGDKTELLHPLTLKPHRYTRPINLDLSKSLTSFRHTDFPFDKVIIPPSRAASLERNYMLVLFDGGQLVARLPLVTMNNRVKWVSISDDKFDDIVIFDDRAIEVDRSGKLYDTLQYKEAKLLRIWPYPMTLPITLRSSHVGFRKRLVPDLKELYLVVRLEVKVFRVFKKSGDYNLYYWDAVYSFDGGKVLFVSKDCCFFTSGFGGREYENCIVFLEAGFPEYRDDDWEYNGEDEIRVYRMSDGRCGKVGESVYFPEIDWSPPSWVFDDREPGEDDRMREQEEQLDSDFRDLECGKMKCNSNSREQEDEQMQSNANREADASLQEDVPASLFVSISAVEEEVKRTLLLMTGGNEPSDKETSRENNTSLAPRACTSSSTNKVSTTPLLPL